MDYDNNKDFGGVISKIIGGGHLNFQESYDAFCMVLKNDVSDMQQGAFLAALTAKGETAEEIAGGWKAIYELDTAKVDIRSDQGVIDNCGTGMDSFKTFNISTAASVVAAAGGLQVARHGARAISSRCGTVDMAECLGVDVECSVEIVAKSIDETGLGLFNGMSPEVHPMALGRILSQIYFGSPLNIAASLANPALPKKAVRGVYRKEMMLPVLEVMRQIGYQNALVVHGSVDQLGQSIDEASVCGTTYCAHFVNNEIKQFEFKPEDFGFKTSSPDAIAAKADLVSSAQHMTDVLSGKVNGAAENIILLNTALLFLVGSTVKTVAEGVELARTLITEGSAIAKLKGWVAAQNRDPEGGLKKLKGYLGDA